MFTIIFVVHSHLSLNLNIEVLLYNHLFVTPDIYTESSILNAKYYFIDISAQRIIQIQFIVIRVKQKIEVYY